MCTSIILFQKEHSWPLIIGSNRDEKLSRISKFPGRYWPKLYPNIIGGYDEEQGGTWIAINDRGMFSIMHNRILELNNNIKKKSRGYIILELLNLESIDSSLDYLQNLNQSNFNGFNIILGDKSNCFWAKHISVESKIEIKEIPEGLSVLTNKDLNDLNDKKTNYYLNKLSQTPIPDPKNNDWLSWELILATEKIENQTQIQEGICFIDKKNNFGTRSSSLIGISNIFSLKQINNPFIFRSTEGPPNNFGFIEVEF